MILLAGYIEKAFVSGMIQYVYMTEIDCDMVDLLFYGHLTFLFSLFSRKFNVHGCRIWRYISWVDVAWSMHTVYINIIVSDSTKITAA